MREVGKLLLNVLLMLLLHLSVFTVNIGMTEKLLDDMEEVKTMVNVKEGKIGYVAGKEVELKEGYESYEKEGYTFYKEELGYVGNVYGIKKGVKVNFNNLEGKIEDGQYTVKELLSLESVKTLYKQKSNEVFITVITVLVIMYMVLGVISGELFPRMYLYFKYQQREEEEYKRAYKLTLLSWQILMSREMEKFKHKVYIGIFAMSVGVYMAFPGEWEHFWGQVQIFSIIYVLFYVFIMSEVNIRGEEMYRKLQEEKEQEVKKDNE